MANGPALEKWLEPLRALKNFSVGIHLNGSLGYPLTEAMRGELKGTQGEFPLKGTLLSSLLLGRISAAVLLSEWRAQIQRCLAFGLQLRFLNSHEHVHMLPMLYSKVRDLAAEFRIPYVRAPEPEWGPIVSLAGCIRSSAFSTLKMLVPRPSQPEPVLIGVAQSGKLDLHYCEWRFKRLRAGGSYELMCHPGWKDGDALKDPRLGAYHDWEGELQLLTSDAFGSLLTDHRIELTTYAP
jgi:predicted glycoside hydrolase/deacetylase ChbG (UPF0249 family)